MYIHYKKKRKPEKFSNVSCNLTAYKSPLLIVIVCFLLFVCVREREKKREKDREEGIEREEERKAQVAPPAKSNLTFLDTGYNQIPSESVLIHWG